MSIFSLFIEDIIYIKNCIDDFVTSQFTIKKEIKQKLNKIIMIQEEFNTKIERGNALVGSLITAFTDLRNAVEEETAQIEAFMASLPENIDVSALDSVLDNLQDAVDDANTLDETVGGIFEPVVQPEVV